MTQGQKMSKNTVAEVGTEQTPVVITEAEPILNPSDPRLIPDNAQVNGYLADGFELSSYRTRNREDAKEEAKKVRKDGTMNSAYITLHQGWFSVFSKPAKAKEGKAAKEGRPSLPVSCNGFDFPSTQECRAFARLLVEAAKQVEFEHDLAKAQAAKAAKTESAE